MNKENSNDIKNKNPFGKKIIVRSQKIASDKNALKNRFLGIFVAFLIAFALIWFIIQSFNFTENNLQNCDIENSEILNEILPKETNYRTPIDTAKIQEDENGGMVVSDRINIALKNKTQKLNDFCINLKKSFPDSVYKIIYYDNETSRIQFQFPEVEKSTIKESLRKKLNSYQLLIWDEAIFVASTNFNDPFFSSREKSWYFDAVNAQKSWDITTGDTSVIIAIVDDGFDLVHPDLIKKNTFPYNVRTQNKNVFGNNQHTHGTHVAGIALANNNNNFGLSGIAPNCGFMPIQISDNSDLFTSTDVIDGILYAIKHKADVINLSLGKQFSERLSEIPISEQESIVKTSAKDEEYFWKELFEYSNKENVTIVLAAGNQNILIGLDPMQRSEFGIVVSAINQNFEKANFSNYGETSTISAPGVGIYSCIPNKQFISYDGTSMSAPIVTGAVALMKTVNPKLTNLEIINILKTSGKKLNTNGLGPLLQIDKAVLAAKEKKTQ